MNRRDFLKATAASSLFAASPKLLMANTDFNGPLVVTVFAHGGWDPTSFCDPKMNMPGEKIINNWAKTHDSQKVGNIQYAPFGENKSFFESHYKKMLVINGIDVKTNSHMAGELYNMTGTMGDGFPGIAALYASVNKSRQIMPWVADKFRPKSGSLIAPAFLC